MNASYECIRLPNGGAQITYLGLIVATFEEGWADLAEDIVENDLNDTSDES